MRTDERRKARKKPEAYSLEYVEEFFGPRTLQMIADRSRSRMVNVGRLLAPERGPVVCHGLSVSDMRPLCYAAVLCSMIR